MHESGHVTRNVSAYQKCVVSMAETNILRNFRRKKTPPALNAILRVLAGGAFPYYFITSLTITYFHTGCSTIIGAKLFHGPVRDGKGWDQLAMVIRHCLVLDCVLTNVALNLEEAV